MIGTTSPGTTLVLIDAILLLLSFPFIVCDFYYANNDYSCVWAPIQSYKINFPLQRWLRVDGAMMLAFLVVMLIIAITICVSPACDWMYPVHAIVGGILAVFRFAWLIVGAVLYWGYLNKAGLCASNIRGYMFANLIIGFLFLALFFVAAFMYPCAPAGGMVAGPLGSGTNVALPVPVQTPSYRGTSAAVF